MDAQVRDKPASDQGFTLVELLVSVAIISVLAVGASLAVARPNSAAHQDMAQFRDFYDLQRDTAILTGQTRGMIVTGTTVQAVILTPEGWHPQGRQRHWRKEVMVTATALNGLPPSPPNIVLLPTGEGSRFRITFGEKLFCDGDGYQRAQCASR